MLGPLRSRMETRIAELERNDPDGTVATWRWMWRALTRSSRSPWRLRLRFTAMVLWDAALLAGWWVFRAPLALARRSPAVVVGLTVGATAVAALLWVSTRHHAPWPAEAEIRLEGASIELMGQRASLDDLRHAAESGKMTGASILIVNKEVSTRQVLDVIGAVTEGVVRPRRVVVRASKDWLR